MEAAIPNLLVRTVSDSLDSSPTSPEHDHPSFPGVSFRKGVAASSVASAGAGGSPLSVSPRSLHIEVRDRKDTSPRSIKPHSSGGFLTWADGESDASPPADDGGMERRSRLLSLGIWSEGPEKGDFDLDFGEEGIGNKEESNFRMGGAGTIAEAGVVDA